MKYLIKPHICLSVTDNVKRLAFSVAYAQTFRHVEANRCYAKKFFSKGNTAGTDVNINKEII